MARTILVPLDGSAASERILPEASRILGTNGRVHLLHLLSGKSAREGKGYLERLRRSAFPRSEGLNLVRTGKAADGILRAALEKNIDLIAMTTHARDGVGRHLLGSVAAEVVRASQLPVLLSRPDTPAPRNPIRRILVPIDGNQSPSDLLQTLRFLCPDAQQEVILLRVLPAVHDPAPQWAVKAPLSPGTSPESRLQDLADGLEEEGFIAWPITSVGNVEEEILAHGRKLEVDLIAMSTHGRGGLERLLEGSVSEQVLRRSPVAVLLQKPLVIHTSRMAGGVHA